MTLLKPLSDRLEEIQTSLYQVTHTTKATLETGMAAQEKILLLKKYEVWVTDKMFQLGMKVRQIQFTFHGCSEQEEGQSDLAVFIHLWLPSLLSLEDGIPLSVLNAS